MLIVRRENRDILTEAGAEGAPDLIVEILSAKTRQLDVVNKKRVYARLGVKELWIVDPDAEAVNVYRFEEVTSEPVQVLRARGRLSTSLLPGFGLAVYAIFRRP